MCAGLGSCANSISEIFALQAQRLHPIDIWDGNSSVAIGHDGVNMHMSAFVVHLEHFSVIRVVVDRHLLIAYHSDTADFTGMEPADMNMGCHAIRKAQIKMSNVMN